MPPFISDLDRKRLLLELRALQGATLQKLWLPSPQVCVLQLRVPGRSALAYLAATAAQGDDELHQWQSLCAAFLLSMSDTSSSPCWARKFNRICSVSRSERSTDSNARAVCSASNRAKLLADSLAPAIAA